MTADPTTPTTRRGRPALRAAVVVAVGAGLLAALGPTAVAEPAGRPGAAGCGDPHGSIAVDPAAADGPERHSDWKAADAALAGLTDPGYSTSALAAVREDGRLVWRNATGVAELTTGEPADPEGRFRIGSTTKTFVATVLLQLVGEHRLDLDDRLECLLPGIVPNSSDITVRQLLDHTSGVADYTQGPAFDSHRPEWAADGRFRHFGLKDLVDLANTYPPAFPPGRDWQDSATDYVLIGMVIEKLTGHGWNDEVTRRIIRPLGLTGTWMPGDSPFVPCPHAHGYLRTGTGPADVTLLDPSAAGPAGGGISTTADLTRFLDALLGGRLLHPAELAAMQQTTANGEGRTYGLGLQRLDTPCGSFWGHAGDVPGYRTMMFGSPDGKRQFAANTTAYAANTTVDNTRTTGHDTPGAASATAAADAAWHEVATTALCGTGTATALPGRSPLTL
ncbi:serine hydrolase domain-containing protein [Streptomyces sp. NRRL S-350]|uniref:serine hydrolase domain-containing protein n=1 Tax=Streptomyces sp. NRRL S-350 TaxID=1463902 RepID=UPI00068943C0|nr:serine hydrolase domain-containing protein [Streptomyces sp. NRRL S-350]